MARKPVHSVRALAVQVAQDSSLQDEIKADPVKAIASMVPPLQTDVWIYRILVIALGLAVLIVAIGDIALAAYGKTIPDALTAIGSAAIGALAGLLTRGATAQE
jgi:hypothetical protein